MWNRSKDPARMRGCGAASRPAESRRVHARRFPGYSPVTPAPSARRRLRVVSFHFRYWLRGAVSILSARPH